MARIGRIVIPEAWHHATQRGNAQQTVFFGDEDRSFYLALLRRSAGRHALRIAGYCLMSNHVHILAAPADALGLARALGRTHNDYSRWLNLRRGTTGHVWQNRFYSCVVDERHRWEALRYIELNPVRAGLAGSAGEWRWSSARAHLEGKDESGLLDLNGWLEQWTPDSGEAPWHWGWTRQRSPTGFGKRHGRAARPPITKPCSPWSGRRAGA